jgi:DNA-binding NarL/FixJ family response regulator
LAAKILIADDHEIFRKGVKQLLSEMTDEVVVDEASNGQEVIKKMWENDYDAVLLDISMPGRNGLDILKQIKSYKPALKVLILSMYPEEQFAIRALKAGADGYVTKASTPGELITALQKILTGKKYISSSLSDKLVCYVEAGDKKALHETLSDREYEVMCMTATGRSVKQIAMELSLSDKTISTYRSRILNKLNVNNIAQLIQYTIQNQLLD